MIIFSSTPNISQNTNNGSHFYTAVSKAFSALYRNPMGFKSITQSWLSENWHVWLKFYDKTEALRRAGREHYGAKCIYESMRYESAVSDSENTFKLNNNVVSGLARLYNAVTGTDYFETRES